jgi:two-component system phosphate regulon sensor histidine kinase PhoR
MIRQAREADSRAANRRAEHKIASRIYALTMSPFASSAQAGATSSENHSIVLLMRDVTKEQEATRNKSEFVARAAHELRAPLSSIRAYVEMLMDGEAGDEKTQEEYYNIIQSSADRLGRMIDNMLNISRIEAGTVRINREAVAISLIVKEVTDMVRPQAEEKGITLTEDLTPVAYRIMADKDMIYQAVLNLLSNAIKYTPDGGKVHVCMTPHEENSTIGIEVSDTGVGIPKEDLPRMFEKFFRVEANKKMAKGTGLGLNLVKHIVETIHEGKVKLSSKVGEGSTFGMVLPLMK